MRKLLCVLFVLVVQIAFAQIAEDQIEDYAVKNIGDTMTGDLLLPSNTVDAATVEADILVLDGTNFATPTPGILGGGAGTVGGSGVNKQVAYWIDNVTLAGNNAFTWDNAIATLTVSGTVDLEVLLFSGTPFATATPGVGSVTSTCTPAETATPLGNWPTYSTATPQPTYAYVPPTAVPTATPLGAWPTYSTPTPPNSLPTLVGFNVATVQPQPYGWDISVDQGEVGGGNVGGSGSNTQVAYWVASATLAGNGAMIFNATTATLTVTNIAGDGAGVTNVDAQTLDGEDSTDFHNASNLDSGSVPNARLDSDLQDLADGSLTGSKVGSGINATNITTGSLANARLDSDLQDLADGSLSGGKVGSGINATNITTGTLAAARFNLTGKDVTDLDDVVSAGSGSIVSAAERTNWNLAYGWGDHGGAGYITGNQTITLSGDVSGSGTTAITTTIGAAKVYETMLFTDGDPPVDEGILTYESGGSAFEWHTRAEVMSGWTGSTDITTVGLLAIDNGELGTDSVSLAKMQDDSVGTSELVDGDVKEGDLDFKNAAVNNYYVTWDSAVSRFEWDELTSSDVGLGNVPNVDWQAELTMDNGAIIYTDEVRALDSDGLELADSSGDVGLTVENGGTVTVEYDETFSADNVTSTANLYLSSGGTSYAWELRTGSTAEWYWDLDASGYIRGDDEVGIRTTPYSPSNGVADLSVYRDIAYGGDLFDMSTARKKKDIQYLQKDREIKPTTRMLKNVGVSYNSFRQQLRGATPAFYRDDIDEATAPMEFGLIAERCPPAMVSKGTDGLFISQAGTRAFFMAVAQDQQNQIDELHEKINGLTTRILALEERL